MRLSVAYLGRLATFHGRLSAAHACEDDAVTLPVPGGDDRCDKMIREINTFLE
jgi:hypothetical protein